MDEAALVRQARTGDKEALIQLVMDRKNEYYRLAYTFTGNREDSLDALQDMIVILFDNIRKLKEPSAFYSWSKTILVNRCRAMLHKSGRVIPLDNRNEEAYHENYPARESRQDILISLERLNSRQQEAIRLKYFMDMDYETIARVTSVPVGTVKSRVFNGLAKLKELLGGEEV
jgi:RNA polymerase sigma-70 factor (ECF subfamily)